MILTTVYQTSLLLKQVELKIILVCLLLAAMELKLCAKSKVIDILTVDEENAIENCMECFKEWSWG